MRFLVCSTLTLLLGQLSNSTKRTTTGVSRPQWLTVRLVDWRSKYEGRVEVIFYGIPGAICYDNFGYREARAVCRMLGYTGGLVFRVGPASPRRLQFLIGEVACQGDEYSLMLCRLSGFGVDKCKHSYAGVRCDPLEGTNVQINGQSCDCSCGNDWVTFGDSCYLFSNAAGMHYVEAEQYCQQHNGAHLVSIETASENTFLRDYASRMNGTQFWIGLTDEMIETVWRWGSVGEKAGYTDWFPGQPDDTSGSEDCAVLEPADQFHWNDRPCINTYRPLCEKSNCDGTNCCPDTWVTYGGSCYLFNNGAGFNFTESQHYCKQHGGVLVTIETSQENTFLKDYISRLNKAYFWMDLTDQQTEGVWKWQTNGQTATFTDWFPGEPNDSAGHEDCAMFFKAGRGYQWNDSPCSDSFHPVCEKK